MSDTNSKKLYDRAVKRLPGGVNSPVRAYQAVGRTPRFIQSAKGAHITDVDGNEMIDYVCSWGPGILGHADPRVVADVKKACDQGLTYGAPTEREVEMAELLAELVPSMEVSRLVSSGTEATMSAIRVARGYTQDHQIQRLLSWTFRWTSGEGRIGCFNDIRSGQCGCSGGLYEEYTGCGVQ